MSSYDQPQQYNFEPGPPGGPHPPQPPPAQYPHAQPAYAQPGHGGQPAPPPGAYGGQPPQQPPGGYVPMPPPQPQPRRRGAIVLASLLSVALIAAIGAFVFFKFVWT
ncbi:MAG TPA: hypothetical protein VKZ65_14510, partial [Glycomyces sp.]|nr:hypothetical protein [Glycomyces sp.]